MPVCYILCQPKSEAELFAKKAPNFSELNAVAPVAPTFQSDMDLN